MIIFACSLCNSFCCSRTTNLKAQIETLEVDNAFGDSSVSRSETPRSDLSSRKRKRESGSGFEKRICEALEAGMAEETEGELYGKLVGKKLDSFDAYRRALARKQIDEILFNLEFDIQRTAPSSSTQAPKQNIVQEGGREYFDLDKMQY